jgi:hypothetical protein
MSDNYYGRTFNHVTRRLHRSPRPLTIHALLFTMFAVSTMVWDMGALSYGVNGGLYWLILLWSIGLFAHAAFTYLRSGLQTGYRERVIEEEVLDTGDMFGLSEDEMVTLHLQLSDEVQTEARPFRRLMWNAAGNLALWPGMFMLMMMVNQGSSMPLGNDPFRTGIFVSVLGTFLLSLILPVRQIFIRVPQEKHARLHTIYGHRQKQKHSPDQVMEIGDDGELFLEPEAPLVKQNRR